MDPSLPPENKLAYSIDEFGQMTGICRATTYKEIASGDLQSMKVGRRRLISADSIEKWIALKQAANQS